MEITLSSRQMDELAYKIALILDKRQRERSKETKQPELVPTNEAARILGITPDRLRHIVCQDPTRYPHIKRGDTSRSQLMFVRDELLQ